MNEDAFPDYEIAIIKYLEHINAVDIDKAGEEYIFTNLEIKIAPFVNKNTEIGMIFHILTSYTQVLRRLYVLRMNSQD